MKPTTPSLVTTPSGFTRRYSSIVTGTMQHALRCICFPLFLASMDGQAQPIELAFPNTGNQFVAYGQAVQGLSDLNGDGIGELAVTSSETARGLGQIGSVYVLSGRDYSVLHRLAPEEAAKGFGFWLGELPDINGDKVPEILIAWLNRLVILVYSGATGELLQTIHGGLSNLTSFGFAMIGLSSTRPESSPHLAISAPSCCDARGSAGRVLVFDAKTGDELFTIENPDNKLWFGGSMANLGDLDGAGRDDLVIGAGPWDIGVGPGAAYIVSGETGIVLRELTVPKPANITHQWDVAAVPDVDADGKTDVLVGIGAGERTGAPKQSGHAFLFSGATGKLLRSFVSPTPRVGGGFGWSVHGVPDVTGDGAGDLLIAAATDSSLGPPYSTFGEKKLYLIDSVTGVVIQSFVSPLVGDGFGLNLTALLGKQGKLRHPVVGVGREKSGAGRVFAFPVRKLTAAKTPDGCEVSLISTDDADHVLQVSSDLTKWETLATLKTAAQPGKFMDKAAVGAERRFYRAHQTNTVP